MKRKAKTINTPVGIFPAPMHPGFSKDLEKCKTDEDLFKMVEPNGFINPDAFNEVIARRLYQEYTNWKEKQS